MTFYRLVMRTLWASILTISCTITHAAEGDLIDIFAFDPALSRPDGMLLGTDGALYVSSYLGKSVLRFDATTGQYIDIFAGEDIPLALKSSFRPSGLTFGPDGHLYVASYDDHRVLRFDGSSGIFIDEFVPQWSGGLLFPTGLAFGPDNNLYVSSTLTDQVLKFDGISGAPLGVFVAAGSGGLNSPKGLVFDQSGNLYVSSNTPNKVIRFDSTGTSSTVVADFTSAPHSILVEANGDLYVSLLNGQVSFYDASLGTTSTIAQGGNRNKGLVLKANGDLLVASSLSNEILILDGTSGTSLVQFASWTGLESPYDIGLGPNGDLLVSSDNQGILRFNKNSGKFMGVFAENPVPIRGLRNFVTGPDGDLYASSESSIDPSVMRFDGTTGAYLGTFVPRSQLGSDVPYDIDFGPDGSLYIAIFSPGQVKRFDAASGTLVNFITPGSGGLAIARGLEFDSDGNVYVTTQDQGVLRYDSSGAPTGVFAVPALLSSPTDLVFGPDLNLFVASSADSRVVRFAGANGDYVDDFTSGAVNGVLSQPNGKVFGEDGNLYVVSTGSNEIQRYEGPEPVQQEIVDVVPGVAGEIDTILNDPATPANAVKDLTKAQDKLDKALAALDGGDVVKAIKEISKATKELLKAEKDGAVVAGLIDQLVETSRLEAQITIDAAIAAGGDPVAIDDALDEMAKAEADLENGKPDKAIDHYRKAQEDAQNAL